MNKKVLWIAIIIVGLTGCTARNRDVSSAVNPSVMGQVQEKQTSKKPRIPDSKELKASILEYKGDSDQDQKETDRLLAEIEKKVSQPTITQEDIERGWYYGSADEKKVGTPKVWIWSKDEKQPRWMSQNAIEETVMVQVEELCERTAGMYVVSCIETDAEDCEYIPRSECRCAEGTLWNENQGCILAVKNEKGEEKFVTITEKELTEGWYLGLPNQKKLDTPANWIWTDVAEDSRWQNPTR
ncbi:hypothetical protein COY07_01415 [Candidatus Peregrinibacteria bacterium CG_4_10_14_0_2_um_filter_43_11]|nr:MAG: hypothetical protein COY07_01415 [Candidatus Peregrinibacteria bacterium CG_4_10_14_0_2_um_filter_43_11]